jgi:multidrug resistance efflux pump
MNEHLEPIRPPAALAWRYMRQQYLPVIVFAVGVVAAAMIWTRWVAPPFLVAEAELVRADVRARMPGSLAGVTVRLLQPVFAGETVGHIITTDPKLIEAQLAVLRAEIEMTRLTMRPVLDQQRVAIDYERLQLDWMSARVELASLQARLHQAESDLARAEGLFRNRMIAEDRHEEVKNTRDALRAQLQAQSELVAKAEPGLRHFGQIVQSPAVAVDEGLRAVVRFYEERLRLTETQLSPVPLTAPIDGVVTAILRRPGEGVVAGEPVFQISATEFDRLVGYIRQPITIEPKPGMVAEVRTRGFQRQVGTATVVQVGQQLEPVSATLLAAMRLPVVEELGLRVHLTPPAGLKLRPGEHVDIILRN